MRRERGSRAGTDPGWTKTMTVAVDRVMAVSARRSRSRSLRVGMIAPPFLPVPPPGYGGIERVVAVLTEGLVEHGHDVTMFAAAGSATSARLVTPLETAPFLGDPASVADDLFHVTAAYLAADAFDVIHDHSGMGPALGSMLAGRTPVVHTLHGPWTAPSRRLLGLVHDRVRLVWERWLEVAPLESNSMA